MKKNHIIFTLCALLLVVGALVTVLLIRDDEEVQNELTRFRANSFEYFDTVSTIEGYEKSGDDFNRVAQSVFATLEEYHKLFDIYNSYEGINNIRTINKPVSALYCVESIRSDQVTQALNKNAERFVYA